MEISSLMINGIDAKYTPEYIGNAFWCQNIAQVSSITLIPYFNNNYEVCNLAYINIYKWCDTEMAHNFVKKLRYDKKEGRIFHNEGDWWSVQINTHNNGIHVGDYTVSFIPGYFTNSIEDNLTFRDYDVEYL